MAVEVILTSLVTEYGSKVGRFIWDKINSDESKKQKFIEGLDNKLGISDILKQIFGNEVNELLQKAKKTKKIQFTSNFNSYISLNIKDDDSLDTKINLLKAELAENLERLNQNNDENKDIMNDARMIFDNWSKKYVTTLNPTDEQIEQLAKLREILQHDNMTAKDIFKRLQPIFGLGGALSTIYIVMLATGAGLGIFAQMGIFLSGIPVAQIGGFIVISAILGYLALIKITDEDKIQIVINGIYKVLDGTTEDISDFLKQVRDEKHIKA
jgi:hypothetical protein